MDNTSAHQPAENEAGVSESPAQVLECRGDIAAILAVPFMLSKHPSTAEEYIVRMLNDLSAIVKKLQTLNSDNIDADFRSNLLVLVSSEFELLSKAPKHLLNDLLILLKEVFNLAEGKDRMFKTLTKKPLSDLILQLEADKK